MINKEYWESFYKDNNLTKIKSPFAEFTLNFLKKFGELKSYNLIDIACGNGRDTFYFANSGIKSIGIDISVNPNSKNVIFLKENILNFDYTNFNVLYLRFIVHSLTENELDILLENIFKIKNGSLIFIETRSTKGITDEQKSETFFKSGVGKEHFRMLYSKDYLTRKLSKKFKILIESEDKGFSPYKGEDPYCIRYILKNK